MDAKSIKNALGLALTIGLGIWMWQSVVTPLMNRLGLTGVVSDVTG